MLPLCCPAAGAGACLGPRRCLAGCWCMPSPCCMARCGSCCCGVAKVAGIGMVQLVMTPLLVCHRQRGSLVAACGLHIDWCICTCIAWLYSHFRCMMMLEVFSCMLVVCDCTPSHALDLMKHLWQAVPAMSHRAVLACACCTTFDAAVGAQGVLMQGAKGLGAKCWSPTLLHCRDASYSPCASKHVASHLTMLLQLYCIEVCIAIVPVYNICVCFGTVIGASHMQTRVP